MKLEIEKETRFILTGALIGAVCGALGALIYYRQRPPQADTASMGKPAAERQEISWQRLASLAWSAAKLVRQIIQVARGD